ncbi:fimbrial biogenesis chaperone [Pseudaeromonas paramecii]|uniref:Molecular chaperone FimB n=1 Tax=Pseudaeromonas paramecii TaxID=2138166 RepID=A0ABP8QF52_9GAMM
MLINHLRHLVWLAAALIAPAQANVVINTTRVIYPASAREVSVSLSNPGEAPALVQAWLDEGDPNAKPDQTQVPFILLPPIFRLDAKQAQALRLTYTQSKALPTDRESLFWLNVLDIPPKPAEDSNYLQLAIRSRLKLFFRPTGLSPEVAKAPTLLKSRLDGQTLWLDNPSPYHLTLTQLTLVLPQGQQALTPSSLMLAPFSRQALPLASPPGKGTLQLTLQSIDDYGALRPQQLAVAR